MQTSLRSRIPNALSVLRIGIGAAIAVLTAVSHPLWLAQALVAAGLVSDKLDGSLARWWKVESETGKKLESVADPFFSFCSALYITSALDFPSIIFWVATALLFIVSIGRVAFKLKLKQFFYKKSPYTRGAVGLVYLLIALYIFQIPYREWLIWPVFIIGCGAWANYVRMMVASVRQSRASRAVSSTTFE